MNTDTGWPQGNNPKVTIELSTLAELWESSTIADHAGLLGNCIIETEGPYQGFCKICSILEEVYELLTSFGYRMPDWL